MSGGAPLVSFLDPGSRREPQVFGAGYKLECNMGKRPGTKKKPNKFLTVTVISNVMSKIR